MGQRRLSRKYVLLLSTMHQRYTACAKIICAKGKGKIKEILCHCCVAGGNCKAAAILLCSDALIRVTGHSVENTKSPLSQEVEGARRQAFAVDIHSSPFQSGNYCTDILTTATGGVLQVDGATAAEWCRFPAIEIRHECHFPICHPLTAWLRYEK